MKIQVDRVFQDLERDTERVSAHLRLLVVVALTVLFLTTDSPDPHKALPLALGAYTAITALAIGLAYFRIFRPWLPWLLVTLDVGVLWLLMAVPARSMGMAGTVILALPMASLIFVILAHAAMRHRPALVGYAAVLFVGAWSIVIASSGNDIQAMGPTHGAMGRMASAAVPWHTTLQEVVRALVIVLTAAILIVTVTRTKRHVLQSINTARRAANLSRFMPESLVEKLSDEDFDRIRDSRRQEAAVMFTDIRGFTTMSETTDPAELGKFLGEFRSRMSVPISRHHGTIDKFIGDAIMAVFGIPQPRAKDARNALECGLAMLALLDQWNEERRAQGLDTVAIGIGIHFGSVFAGALGDENRLEYTVIGDTVNVAERLEKLTRGFDTELIVSGDLLRAAGETPDPQRWDKLPIDTVKGRSGEIVAYSLRTRNATASAPSPGMGSHLGQPEM